MSKIINCLKEEELKYDAIANKESKSAANKREKIVKIQNELSELEKIKYEVPLSDTAQTYIKQVFRAKKYNRRKGLINKYIEKGLYNEEDAITMLSELDKIYYRKNEKFFENDFIKGTPDIILKDLIIDIKCSFDLWTFPFPDDEINKLYYWQLQSYMALTDRQEAQLVYVLTDTPEFMIKREKSQLMYKIGVNPDDSEEKLTEMYYRVEREMRFEDIPLNERIIKFDINRNDADIARIYSQVEKCRQYYETLK